MTATSAAAKPEVFTRKASGLVRVMSPYSAFVYNILTMGLIFPWTYLWAPGALPGGKMVWGILLAMVIEIPIAFAYVWLSTALPRSGGDYVFQSRVFGGDGLHDCDVWLCALILQWVALGLLFHLDLPRCPRPGRYAVKSHTVQSGHLLLHPPASSSSAR
jgi:amino acid transporter